MKTTILLFFIIICSNFVYAQQCKTKVEIDDFSGETKLYSQPIEIVARNKFAVIKGEHQSTGWFLRISFEKENGIQMHVRHESTHTYNPSLVTAFDIKFNDGSVIRLSNPKDMGVQVGKLIGKRAKVYSSLFSLTEEQLDAFVLNKIVKCRAVFADNYLDPTYEKEVKDSQATLVQKEAKCFLETMVNQE
ncbi:hypothetical protein [Leadbetterella sp. DM7]|uniref:hypothetical protein n=1 Tax=Leadbetterella sp. DM7 TaxID=3235085 RepID=UPI00349E51FE